MNDLTPHQRDILIAILQNKRIERMWRLPSDLTWIPCDNVWYWLDNEPSELRVAPNQCEDVRLYCAKPGTELNNEFLLTPKPLPGYDTHYIDISPNGFIVGGKIEDIAK